MHVILRRASWTLMIAPRLRALIRLKEIKRWGTQLNLAKRVAIHRSIRPTHLICPLLSTWRETVGTYDMVKRSLVRKIHVVCEEGVSLVRKNKVSCRGFNARAGVPSKCRVLFLSPFCKPIGINTS